MVRIWGYEIKRDAPDVEKEHPSFSPPISDDGAVVVTAGGIQGTYVDINGSVRSEAELVTKYRDMTLHPEVKSAVTQICNESIVQQDFEPIVKITLEALDNMLPPAIKEAIENEFDRVQELLEFNTKAYEIFEKWYVDGRLYYNIIIDPKNPQAGIQELRYLDPRCIRKVKEIAKAKNPEIQSVPGSDVINRVVNEYFVYNDKGFQATSTPGSAPSMPLTGLKIAKDAVVHVVSGLTDTNNTLVLSHLHIAIKYLNMLRSVEDAGLIYRVTRAPERRVFYIDVGGLPRIKAEEYVKSLMTKFKTKVVYDAQSGEIRDDRKFMTFTDDYWLATRDGGKAGTRIDTLQPGQMQGIIDEMEYYKMGLYKSLQVPYSRFNPEAVFSYGRAQEISRDEIDFCKFVDRLHLRFSHLFLRVLEKQLVLRGVIAPEDWSAISYRIKFIWQRDNLYSELKEKAMLAERGNLLQFYVPFAGSLVSYKWIRETILQQSEEDQEKIDMEIIEELNNPQYSPELLNPMGAPDQGGNVPGPAAPVQQQQQQQIPNQKGQR
jgi:hypothetical protein